MTSRASEPLDYLFGLEQFGIKFGLENIRTLVAALGHPERAFPSVHIAGTNGKGSVTAMVDAGLRAAGHRSGRFTSPHLIDLTERFAIDDRPVALEALVAAAADLRGRVEALIGSGALRAHPTFFEATTAIGLELFRRAAVDVAIIEVGLGGRLDSTNVITPMATAITSIAFDHEAYLGHTLSAIATEKAGIIKPQVPVVVGRVPAEAEAAIDAVARDRGSEVVRAWDGVIVDPGRHARGAATRVRLRTPAHDYGEITISLRGTHQIGNAVVAVRLLELLDQRGLVVAPDAIVRGLGTVTWPGRLDHRQLSHGREMLLDAAHNPAGAAMLAEYITDTFDEKPPLVFAAMRDKDATRMFEVLLPSVGALIVTRASTTRSADPETLAQHATAVAPGLRVLIEPERADALAAAWNLSPRIVVAGSIFLLGDVLKETEGSVIPSDGTLGMRTILRTIILGVIVGLMAGVARAQQAIVASPGQTETQSSLALEIIGDNRYIRRGDVQIDLGDTQIYAEEVEFFTDQNRMTAKGNVVVSQANSRIAADRADFDLKTKLGTFYNAWGMAPIGPQKTRATSTAGPTAALAGGLFGSVTAATTSIAGQALTADTDVYFFGETIQKTGPKKYRITNGGFTTCVQPTPRWELHSSTVVLNLDEYTVLRNAVFRVKGVPLLYTPFLYYPTKRDDRATGILLPTYGATSLRGQSIHNAFFWAIDRSQDATALYDWFSNAAHGYGSEYRYNYGPGSNGNFKSYWLDRKQSTDEFGGALAAERSYEMRGAANQSLPRGFRARANVNYFSSLTAMQTTNTNVYDASRNQRNYGGNVVGLVGNFSLNGTMDRNEYFTGSNSSAVYSSWPRVTVSRNERPLLGSRAYFSLVGDYSNLVRENTNDAVTTDLSNTRFEVMPQIRYPFTKWQWFTVNTTVSWRETYYGRSLAPGTGTAIDEGLNRNFFQFQARFTGPVIARVWNTPENGYAEKFKHSVEPFLSVDRTTAIDDFDRIIQVDAGDSIVGGATRYVYGVVNRFYAKQRRPGAPIGQAREIASVDVTQSYYSDERSAKYDPTYMTSFLGAPPSNFSPIAVNARAAPTDLFNVTLRAEIDSQYLALRTISANGSYSASRVTATGGWSKRALIPGLATFDDPARLDQYINGSGSAHTTDNAVGATYSIYYDVLNSRLLQQRLTGFYNSQCCGLAFEYQVFNFSGLATGVTGLSQDHRFFMSFTLAGLGNFSPFNGALSGAPR